MDLNDILSPTIIFEPPAASPDRRRCRHRHRRVQPVLLSGEWDTDSTDGYPSDSDGYSSSDDGPLGVYCYRQPRRRHHRHIRLLASLPNGVSNALVRRPTATATTATTPQNYGYRRLHYQGGREHRVRQRTRPVHCAASAVRPGCGVRSPQRNILVRCGRWLFGESRRYYCGRGEGCEGLCAPASRHCGDERSRSRSRSPTRHREEEYWGPGRQVGRYFSSECSAKCVAHEEEANRKNSNGPMVHQLATQIGETLLGPPAAMVASTDIILRRAVLLRKLKRAALFPQRQQSRIERTTTTT